LPQLDLRLVKRPGHALAPNVHSRAGPLTQMQRLGGGPGSLNPQSQILSTSPSNYRPISNLSLIYKIIERVVKSRLMDYLISNSLLNSHQSAYCKHHSTETALLYIHDHLISAIGTQKVSCLCLLDLSAAFDTIDHDILITRLSSWFGIHGSALSWFKSYLSSRCFRVKCETDLSSWR